MPSIATLRNFKYSVLLASSRAGILDHFNFRVSKKLNGQSFVLPISNGIGYQNLVNTEPWSVTLYSKVLSLFSGTFVDVGVNNGQTILKIAAINRRQPYIGFEPNPVCYNYSRRLIKVNGLNTFTIIPVGLHFENKIVELYHDTEFASGASMLQNFRVNKSRYHQVQHVSVMVGDDVLHTKGVEAVSMIKADVEGVELEVMQGLQKSLATFKPVVMLEILPVYNAQSENGSFRKSRQDQLVQLMQGLGFAMLRIDEKNTTLQLLRDIEVHSDMNKTNYLFVHHDKLSTLSKAFEIT